jgi:hypothetical protein
MFYRVFSATLADVAPAELLEHLTAHGLPVTGHFRGDEVGWFAAELVFTDRSETPVFVERFLTKDDELRADLNAWAAWLETADYSPNHTLLMERMIQTQQLWTLRQPIDHADEVQLEQLLVLTCQYLATHTQGVYHVDNRGFFAADGTALLQEY